MPCDAGLTYTSGITDEQKENALTVRSRRFPF